MPVEKFNVPFLQTFLHFKQLYKHSFLPNSSQTVTPNPFKMKTNKLREPQTGNNDLNCFRDTNDEEEDDEIKTVLPSKLDNENETETETKRDEPQYSMAKVSSFGSLYRLSQVSFHSNNDHKACPPPHDNHDENENNNKIGNNLYIDVISDADICCGKTLTDCIALQRLLSILVFYSANYKNYEAIEKYLHVYNMKKHLINDYHHLLNKHLNEDNMSTHKSNKHFNCIYKTMTEESHLYCDISHCFIYERNHRQRETTQIFPPCNDINISMFVDILDVIHCYFLHSVDTCHRIMVPFEQKSDPQNIYNAYDSPLSQLRQYLQTNLAQIRGKKVKQFPDSRFLTTLSNRKKGMEGYLKKESLYLKQLRLRYMVLSGDCLYSYKTNKCKELTETLDLKLYNHVEISADGPVGQFELVQEHSDKKRVLVAASMQELDEWLHAFKLCIGSVDRSNENQFGERFDYWSACRIYPKYESIKEEITNNAMFNISVPAFNAAFNKSKYLINSCDRMRNLMTCAEVLKIYNFRYDAVIRIDHILALVLWTDYRRLAKELRATFTRISKKIYDEFWIWSKFLIEAVNAFGERLKKAKVKTCYHCVSFVYYSCFQTTFNVPTSTSAKLQSALIPLINTRMDREGIILELGHNEKRFSKKMRYFNCSFISCFANEDERLFIQPPDNNYYFEILCIRNLQSDENYKQYMRAMEVLQRLVSNQLHNIAKDAYDRKCIEMVNYLISVLYDNGEVDDAKCPQYIRNILMKWSGNVSNISFDSYFNRKIVPNTGINIFNADNIVQFDKLNIMFKQMECIEVDSAKYIKIKDWIEIADMLDIINKIKDSKLKQIYIIHRDCGDVIALNWNEIKHLICNKKWQIVDVESKAICMTRAEDT